MYIGHSVKDMFGKASWNAPLHTQPTKAEASSPTREYKFVKQLEERFNCMICHELQKQPVLVSCCGQHFCQSCLTKWFTGKTAKTCPHCNEEVGIHMLNKQQQRDINELEVYCFNQDKGCRWRGSVKSIEEHINTSRSISISAGTSQQQIKLCEYESVLCPNKCMLKVLRHEVQYHLRSECLCRDYKCRHCGLQGTYHSITGECGEFGPCELHGDGHNKECPDFPVDCPNKCFNTIKRKELAAHRETCPLELVKCSFSEVGCDVSSVRSDLKNHLATGNHQHLLLKALKEVKDENQKLKQRVNSLELKLQAASDNPKTKANTKFSKVSEAPSTLGSSPTDVKNLGATSDLNFSPSLTTGFSFDPKLEATGLNFSPSLTTGFSFDPKLEATGLNFSPRYDFTDGKTTSFKFSVPSDNASHTGLKQKYRLRRRRYDLPRTTQNQRKSCCFQET